MFELSIIIHFIRSIYKLCNNFLTEHTHIDLMQLLLDFFILIPRNPLTKNYSADGAHLITFYDLCDHLQSILGENTGCTESIILILQ